MAKKPAKKEKGVKKGYRIVKKRSGRYTVYKKGRKLVNGDAKVAILVAEGLIKVLKPKAQA